MTDLMITQAVTFFGGIALILIGVGLLRNPHPRFPKGIPEGIQEEVREKSFARTLNRRAAVLAFALGIAGVVFSVISFLRHGAG